MRYIILAIAIVGLFCVAANAADFLISDDFQGDVSSTWQFYSEGDSFVGVIDDPTAPGSGNKVLLIDNWDEADLAYAIRLEGSEFNSIDGSQPVTLSFRFFLDNADNSGFNIINTLFSGIADYDNWYWTGVGEYICEIPVGRWVNFKYVLTPDTGSTHELYIDDYFWGEFENVDNKPLGAAYLLGDDQGYGYTYGKAMWDDIQISGTAVPEPGSIISLVAGLGGLIPLCKRRRRS